MREDTVPPFAWVSHIVGYWLECPECELCELRVDGVLGSPLWVELLLYQRLCCLSCVYRVCVPMHYLPLTVFGAKDHRGPKDPRGDFLASADLGLTPLYLHHVGELGSRVFLYDLGANQLAISELRCGTLYGRSNPLPSMCGRG
jgi:hypothetical protein